MRHGSPEDRGSADRYYGRPYSPHKIVIGVRTETLSPAEKYAYTKGYDEEQDEKDW